MDRSNKTHHPEDPNPYLPPITEKEVEDAVKNLEEPKLFIVESAITAPSGVEAQMLIEDRLNQAPILSDEAIFSGISKAYHDRITDPAEITGGDPDL